MSTADSLRALIFDVDGTLAETEELHRRAFNAAFEEAHLGWVWDRKCYGALLKTTGGKERIRAYISAQRLAVAGADVEALIDALHRRKTTIYTGWIATGRVNLRPGIQALIEAARACGVRLAIATTTSRPNVEALIQAALGCGLSEYFEVVATGESVRSKKPAPDVYLHVLHAMGLQPSACLAIEDTENGLLSARGAFIPVLITRSTYSKDESFDGAIAVLDDLNDLYRLSDGREAGNVDGPGLLDAIVRLHGGRPEAGTADMVQVGLTI